MNYFVFAVCGASEHIDTLNFSLRYIRHFSQYPVLVVTDSRRNEKPIDHDQIIDIETPGHFDHHMASIFLKTGLHKFVDMSRENLYCYLDSDIVAINNEINSIFEHFKSPIIFANDHCSFDEFSPHAMNCTCLDETLRRNKEYQAVDDFFKQKIFLQTYNETDKAMLDHLFAELADSGFKSKLKSLVYFGKRYVLPLKQFSFGGFTFNRKTRMWCNSKGEFAGFDFRYYANQLQRKTGLHFDAKTAAWFNKDGENIMPAVANCSHLREHIINKFGIEIPVVWSHRNGGVFLFDASSVEFLNYWHRLSVDEFSDPKTKTRDQGTLAVSMWNFGLQHSESLLKKFNFITEYNNKNIAYSSDKGFTFDGFETSFSPCFLHIYHEWGHIGWSIWDYVEAMGKEIKELP